MASVFAHAPCRLALLAARDPFGRGGLLIFLNKTELATEVTEVTEEETTM